MPRKIRELKADLRRAGYREMKKRGKGSHTWWEHPLVADAVNISGHDGADARNYQEKVVADFVERARKAERGAKSDGG